MRQQPGRARRRRTSRHGTHLGTPHLALDAIGQGLEAAKQHQARRHFKQHRIGRQRHHRRKIERHQPDALLQRRLARRLTPPHRKISHQRPRRAQCHAGTNAAITRRRIGCQNQGPLVRPIDHRKRHINEQAAPGRLQGQLRQKQRNPQRLGHVNATRERHRSGCISASSPMLVWSHNNSVNAPRGQPPSGNSRSRAANPVARPSVHGGGRSPMHQMAER